jgi:adenylate cyclase
MAKQPVDEKHDATPTAAEVRAALERILQSRCFEHANRASDFLRFVVEKTLAGEADQLKGYAIAIHVFGRPRDFNAKSDPLVRVEALRLRQRLTEYYAGEGFGDLVRLELPRGSYAVKAYSTCRLEPPGPVEVPAPWHRSAAALQRHGRTVASAATVLFVAVLSAVALQEPARVADVELWGSAAAASQAGPDAHRTKITVVPLENLSATPRLDRLAAGLTEEIMVRLGELNLYVIAAQASWYRPGKALDGVVRMEHSYVLTGSVRDQSGGARITLRILEAETGAQIWAAAYDEPPGIEGQPELQMKVARDAAAAAGLFGPVFDAELTLTRRSSHTLELPDCQTRYRAFRRATNPALFPEAFACFEGLVARHPQLAHAWAGLAMLYIDEHVYYSGAGDGGAAFNRAHNAVQRALELDSMNVLANGALTRYQYYAGDPEFVRTADRTIELDPNNGDMVGLLGILLTAYGDSMHGLELVARAEELAPTPRPLLNLARVFADLQDNKPCAALARAQQMDANSWFIAHMVAAAAAGLCGDDDAAAEARRKLLAVAPDFEAEAVGLVDLWKFNDPLRDAMLAGLQAAGLELHHNGAPPQH